MPKIEVLDKMTIDKIAAGEVVERPSSVVKELVENAIDAKATAVTIEIKEGGISFIRITDNGSGIAKEDVKTAFLRHSTSKIRSANDLESVASLGFRGEALSSIAAVSQVELITKTTSDFTGIRYCIEGGEEGEIEEIGAPEGTTFIVRNLFFHTPARKKFLKTPQTEAGYISSLVEKLALSHPDISFQLIVNQQPKLHTSGNNRIKDMIFQIYGRDIAANLIGIHEQNERFKVDGFIGKPIISRGNRNFENYFVNGRYIKSSLISKAIEDGYKLHLMQHQYPFTVLHFQFVTDGLDVNVHPTKMELRFSNNEQIYDLLRTIIKKALDEKEMIPDAGLGSGKKQKDAPQKEKKSVIEPFETNRRKDSQPKGADAKPEWKTAEMLDSLRKVVAESSPYEKKYGQQPKKTVPTKYPAFSYQPETLPEFAKKEDAASIQNTGHQTEIKPDSYEQTTLFGEETESAPLLKSNSLDRIRIIGQLFDTYWLMEYNKQLYIMDQHAAHEKVLFERTMKNLEKKEHSSQLISPPLVLTLSMREQELLERYGQEFTRLGFEFSQFGGNEYAVSAVPQNLFSLNKKELFLEMLDGLDDIRPNATPQTVIEKIASMSCKAAVKGNQKLSTQEAESLIAELMTLENPYQCPHGRPTIITMTKQELEKKFKRIV